MSEPIHTPQNLPGFDDTGDAPNPKDKARGEFFETEHVCGKCRRPAGDETVVWRAGERRFVCYACGAVDKELTRQAEAML